MFIGGDNCQLSGRQNIARRAPRLVGGQSMWEIGGAGGQADGPAGAPHRRLAAPAAPSLCRPQLEHALGAPACARCRPARMRRPASSAQLRNSWASLAGNARQQKKAARPAARPAKGDRASRKCCVAAKYPRARPAAAAGFWKIEKLKACGRRLKVIRCRPAPMFARRRPVSAPLPI